MFKKLTRLTLLTLIAVALPTVFLFVGSAWMLKASGRRDAQPCYANAGIPGTKSLAGKACGYSSQIAKDYWGALKNGGCIDAEINFLKIDLFLFVPIYCGLAAFSVWLVGRPRRFRDTILLLLPVFLLFFADVLETSIHLTHLTNDGVSDFLIDVSGYATTIKWLLALAVAILLIGLIIRRWILDMKAPHVGNETPL